ncbi:hypothetical protein NQ318_007100 [Aromia moschata]|uniref:Uncharacterized protein n=1 Tax=Aromia moschata TaxID=1265417 RepID=A0AAV8XTU8_9CUCU|nr:hypothetical protein NQ318_007100 [Aromia moschata]
MDAKRKRVKVWTAKKEQYFTRIQQLLDISKDVTTPEKIAKFKLKLETVEKTKNSLLEALDEINLLECDLNEDFVPNYAVLDVVDEMMCQIISVEKSLKTPNPGDSHRTRSSLEGRPSPKLPKLPLPKFSGDIKEWPLFIECYNSMIHNNLELNDVDKVHYLIGCLSGSALNVCSGIPPTGDNYNIILKALIDKFEDKRILANSYIEQILHFKQASTESYSSLNIFLEKFDSTVTALLKLNIDNLADYFIAYLALAKLNPETQKLFENSRRSSEMPSYEEIKIFVKEQAKICSRTQNNDKISTGSYSKNNSTGGKPKVTHSFVVHGSSSTSNLKCHLCKSDSHYLNTCSKFLKMSPEERYRQVRNNNLCLNCLATHKVINCRSNNTCRTCHARHHTLLHFKSNRLSACSSGDKTNSKLVDISDSSKAIENDQFNPLPSTSTTDVIVNNNGSSNPSEQALVNFCSLTNTRLSRRHCNTVLLSTLYHQLVEMFQTGGFQIMKWATNSKELLANIPLENHTSKIVSFESDRLKVLGLQWQPSLDVFSFSFDVPKEICSKRHILSTVARCYDPLGFLAPVTLLAKLLIKQLWILKLDWDEVPPPDIIRKWDQFKNDLPLLSTFEIPRHIGTGNNHPVIIIGFCDACSSSYGDSTVTLNWIATHPSKLPTFVANRVAQIQTFISPNSWFHVDGQNNISDCLSRGLTPRQLVNNPTWTLGPDWFKLSPSLWPICRVAPNVPENKVVSVVVTKTYDLDNSFLNLIERKSKWLRLLNSVVYVLRFLKLLLKSSVISNIDLEKAEMWPLGIIEKTYGGRDNIVRVVDVRTKNVDLIANTTSGHTFLSATSFHHEVGLRKHSEIYDFQDFVNVVQQCNLSRVVVKEMPCSDFREWSTLTSAYQLHKLNVHKNSTIQLFYSIKYLKIRIIVRISFYMK